MFRCYFILNENNGNYVQAWVRHWMVEIKPLIFIKLFFIRKLIIVKNNTLNYITEWKKNYRRILKIIVNIISC